MSSWQIGLAAWIIQDGNYGDFARDQRTAFALEFYPHSLRGTAIEEIHAVINGPSRYRVNARVVAVLKNAWVIDFGIRAFQETIPPKNLTIGDWVDADIFLGVDPFFYFEDLSRSKEMPALIYDWHIQKVSIQTAPFIESHDALGRAMRIRDELKSEYREIERSDAWKDDGGSGDYVLHCELMHSQPRKTLK